MGARASLHPDHDTGSHESQTKRITRLFRMVIHQAIDDAVREKPTNSYHHSYDHKSARDWLKYKGKDFMMVCSMAEISPREVDEWFNRRRRELGMGTRRQRTSQKHGILKRTE